MKLILNFAILFSVLFHAKAQEKTLLPKDEQGKFIYYEVVELKQTAKTSLQKRANSYFNGQQLKLKSVVGDSIFSSTGKFIINKTLLVMSHPSGEISYNLRMELKENKYRFWMGDFSFIPYKRDRYGNFVPSTSIGSPLENEPGKLNASQWKEYQVQTTVFAIAAADKLKNHMANITVETPVAVEKAVVSKNW